MIKAEVTVRNDSIQVGNGIIDQGINGSWFVMMMGKIVFECVYLEEAIKYCLEN